MAFTEFYCDPVNGSNANGGDDANASPSFTSAIGSWDGTSVYTVGSTTGATVGQYMNVGGTYVAKISSIVTNTSITLSTTLKAGTAPGAGVRTANVGGAWKGPNGADLWPISTTMSALATNVRINLKNNGTYSITATIASGGGVTIQGYSSTVGDGGRATLSFGTTTGDLLTVGSGSVYSNLIITSSASSGTGSCYVSLNPAYAYDVVVTGARNSGFKVTGGDTTFYGCEAYGCNTGNGSNIGGFLSSGTGSMSCYRCNSHDNVNSCSGFYSTATGASTIFDHCIADTNPGRGFRISSNIALVMNCTSYKNTSHGLEITGAAGLVVNSIFDSNGTSGTVYGVSGAATNNVILRNNGFYNNFTAATNNINAEYNSVNFASSPMKDPVNGEFTPVIAAALRSGLGTFPQDAGSYSKFTTSYPDRGAVQSRLGLALRGLRMGGRF